MQKLLIATTNQHKFGEFQALLADLPFELLSLRDVGITDDVEETGTTFSENARLKAEGYSQLSGLLTLADDSGIEIAALRGAPGIHSARYGGVTGAAQLALVLKQLEGVPFGDRIARFVCVIAITGPDQPLQTVEAILPGVVEFEPKGEHGFGYDPIFYLLDFDKTMAELSTEQKNQISHRAQATRKAKVLLQAISEHHATK